MSRPVSEYSNGGSFGEDWCFCFFVSNWEGEKRSKGDLLSVTQQLEIVK